MMWHGLCPIRQIYGSSKPPRLEVPLERFFVNVDRYGNTSAASIAIALDELARSGELHHGQNVVTVGFGAGLTWAAVALRWWERGETHG